MNWAYLSRWTFVLGKFTSFQFLIQIINALTGFMIIRLMDKPQYGAFTVANSMMSMASLLGDGGITHALPAVGGSFWNNRPQFSSLISTALRFRKWLLLNATVISLPVAIWVFLRSGLTPGQTAVFCLLSITAAWPSASASILNSASRLHARFRQIQQFDLWGAVARAAWCAGAVLMGLSALTALEGSLVAVIVQWIVVRRQVAPILDFHAQPSEALGLQLKEKLWQLYPFILFYALQGQIGIWLISVLAKAEKTADLGALSRLSILFVVLAAPIGSIAAPAFSRAQDLRRLRVIFLQTLFVFALVAACITLACWLVPHWILWVLGTRYYHLQRELFWFSIASSLAGAAAIAWGLCTARGWTRLAWLNVPAVLAALVAGALCFDVSRVMGVIWLNGLTSLASIVPAVWIAWREMRRNRLVVAV